MGKHLKVEQPTRGHGALEGYLARRRARKANQLIPSESRSGRLLDIGCGSYPYFLATTRFAEKWGVDQVFEAEARLQLGTEHVNLLPFDAQHDRAQNRGMAAEALIPTSPDEAASLFGEGKNVTVFGGGTILLPEIASGRLKLTRALMLHRSGLDSLDTAGDVVRIGAMTTIAASSGTAPCCASTTLSTV